MTAASAADTRDLPVADLLLGAHAYLTAAREQNRWVDEGRWLDAIDRLLDRLLLERPELSCRN